MARCFHCCVGDLVFLLIVNVVLAVQYFQFLREMRHVCACRGILSECILSIVFFIFQRC